MNIHLRSSRVALRDCLATKGTMPRLPAGTQREQWGRRPAIRWDGYVLIVAGVLMALGVAINGPIHGSPPTPPGVLKAQDEADYRNQREDLTLRLRACENHRSEVLSAIDHQDRLMAYRKAAYGISGCDEARAEFEGANFALSDRAAADKLNAAMDDCIKAMTVYSQSFIAAGSVFDQAAWPGADAVDKIKRDLARAQHRADDCQNNLNSIERAAGFYSNPLGTADPDVENAAFEDPDTLRDIAAYQPPTPAQPVITLRPRAYAPRAMPRIGPGFHIRR